jgi:hypothetical protein
MSESNQKNSQDLNNPEYWESLGIKPIVIDENDPDYINKVTEQITERIKEAVEELKKEDK